MNRLKYASCALLLVSACGRPKEEDTLKRPVTETVYELDLREALPELGVSFLGQTQPGLGEALGRLRELSEEPLAKGLFVRLGAHQGHLGDVEDLAAAFEAFRAQKRPVHCHFEELDNAGYALASHCDRLSIAPAGMLNLVGLGAQVMHGRKLLNWLGVKAELLQMGQYKGAADPFTREELSPTLRASMDKLLEDLDASFRKHLQVRSERTPEIWQAVIDGGPYSPNEALAHALVDSVAQDDEARAKARIAGSARIVKPVFERGDKDLTFRELVLALAGDERKSRAGQPYLAMGYLTGEIVEGTEGSFDRTASDPFINTLRRWGDDRLVRAVVLRIESPGGSALASDRMWHMVRRVAGRKPVIVSLGDVAASGGYYVASAGNHIVAAPGSIVGSIGVVGGKMVVQELAERAGLRVDTLKRAQHALWLSPFTPFSESERARFETMIEGTYDLFLKRISTGRKRPVASLLPAAEGRVMGGARAVELGLVDELGGLSRAIDIARERGKLTPRSPVDVWPDSQDTLRALSSMFGVQQPHMASHATLSQLMRAAKPLVSSPLLTILGEAREPVVLAMPFDLEVH